MQQKPVEALIVFNISFTKGKVRITEHTDCVISEVYTNNFKLQKQPWNINLRHLCPFVCLYVRDATYFVFNYYIYDVI